MLLSYPVVTDPLRIMIKIRIMSAISISSVLLWILLGIVAGIILQAADRQDVRGGMLMTILFGIIGGLLGGFLANAFLGITTAGIDMTVALFSLIGGLALAFLYRVFFHVVPATRFYYQPAGNGAGRKGGSVKVNPVQVQKYLRGMDYPAGKNQILEKARQEGADSPVLDLLEKLPDQEYTSPAALSAGLGKIE